MSKIFSVEHFGGQGIDIGFLDHPYKAVVGLRYKKDGEKMILEGVQANLNCKSGEGGDTILDFNCSTGEVVIKREDLGTHKMVVFDITYDNILKIIKDQEVESDKQIEDLGLVVG